jgi:hypothetical protein
MRNVYNILVGKPVRKRSFGRYRHRWKYNIRTNLRKVVWEGVDLINLAQDRDQWRVLVKTIMNLRVA